MQRQLTPSSEGIGGCVPLEIAFRSILSLAATLQLATVQLVPSNNYPGAMIAWQRFCRQDQTRFGFYRRPSETRSLHVPRTFAAVFLAWCSEASSTDVDCVMIQQRL